MHLGLLHPGGLLHLQGLPHPGGLLHLQRLPHPGAGGAAPPWGGCSTCSGVGVGCSEFCPLGSQDSHLGTEVWSGPSCGDTHTVKESGSQMQTQGWGSPQHSCALPVGRDRGSTAGHLPPLATHDACVHGSVSLEPQRAAHVRAPARWCHEQRGSSSTKLSFQGPHTPPTALREAWPGTRLPEAPRCWSESEAQALHSHSACHPPPAWATVSPLTTCPSVPQTS